ncbi:glycosyltransferase [Rhizobium sp. TRM95111]|nr:glycosyltransferase [Rhizobium alarense]
MLARFARSLAEADIEPQVLSLLKLGPVAALFGQSGIHVESLDMDQSTISVAAIRKLRATVLRSRADIFHGWMYHGNLAASLAALFQRPRPVIWSIHHSVDDIRAEKRSTRWVIRLLARLSSSATAISYCSRASARQHEALGFDSSRSVIVPNGIDCDSFRPVDGARLRLQRQFSIPSDRLIVGNVARAHPMKDHESFLRAIAALDRQGLNVHGLIIGAGHEEDSAARRTARELGIDHRLSTPGPRSDVAELLPGLDVFLLSSAWGEAFPLSVAEAMACGVPAIATDVGDCDWLLGDRRYIARPREPESQAALVGDLLRLEAGERKLLGTLARKRIVENFSLQQYTEGHRQIYETALSRQHLRSAA